MNDSPPPHFAGDPEHRLAIVSAGLEAAAHELQLLVDQMRRVLENVRSAAFTGEDGDAGPAGPGEDTDDRGERHVA